MAVFVLVIFVVVIFSVVIVVVIMIIILIIIMTLIMIMIFLGYLEAGISGSSGPLGSGSRLLLAPRSREKNCLDTFGHHGATVGAPCWGRKVAVGRAG